ncbi:MAG: helix-turn-helix domain-containing protein [Gemmataceae bacterium]
MTETEAQASQVIASAEDIPEVLRQLRRARGLSQRELARLAGTRASVICRLENPSYRGHSLEMLKRVGAVLGVAVTVRFASRERLPLASDGAEGVRAEHNSGRRAGVPA